MRDGRVDMQLLEQVLAAKGHPVETLREPPLNFTKYQVASWFSSGRRPRGGDAIRIAHWLEIPTEVLCGLDVPGYAGLSPARIAAKGSFERFVAGDPRVRGKAHDILEQYASASGAPKKAADWAQLYERLFLPATYLGHEQEQELRRMVQSPATRRKRKGEAG